MKIKINDVGIVYEVGEQAGDNIDNYGADAKGKSILGYVMALKNIDTKLMGLTNNVHSVSGRPYLYKHSGGTVEAGVQLFDPIKPDKTNFTGYTKTNELLNSEQYNGHSTDWELSGPSGPDNLESQWSPRDGECK